MKYVNTHCEFNEKFKDQNRYCEKNDCTVMAMATAFGISYKVAHNHIKKNLGRVDGKPVRMFPSFSSSFPFGTVDTHRFKIDGIKNNITLGKFCEQHPKGRFILLVQGHALAVVDGVVYDHSEKPRRHVLLAYEIMEKFDEAA